METINHSQTSVSKPIGFGMAMAIAKICPEARFCGFSVTPDGRKLPHSKVGVGVSADTPIHNLYTAEEIDQIPSHMHVGVVMQHATSDAFEQAVLVIFDVDMKRSNAPADIRIRRLAQWAKEHHHISERSHSKMGRHVSFLAKPDPRIPGRIKLGNNQELEIFGMPHGPGKSVMLTDDELSQTDISAETVDLYEVLVDLGFINPEKEQAEQHKHKQEPMLAPMRSMSEDMERTDDALSHISPDIDYSDWIAIGQALHDAYGESGLSMWHAWSQNGTKYQGSNDIETHWKSFHQGKGVGLGSLFHLAKQHGWEPPTKHTERRTAVQDFMANAKSQEVEETVEVISTSTEPATGWDEVSYDVMSIKATRYLIDGFLAHGFWLLAGQPGVGKTTAIVCLMMIMIGGTTDLKITRHRKIILVSEDVDQVRRTLYAYAQFNNVSKDLIQQMVVLIEARRSTLPELLDLHHNIERHTIPDGTRPFLILDTASAILELESENDNSEVGAFMAGLKQTIYAQMDTPLAIVTHTNKQISKTDQDAMARGASAFTGDATGTMVVFMDEAQNRFLRLIKTRYEPRFREIGFTTETHSVALIDQDGNMQDEILRTMTAHESSEEERVQEQAERSEQDQQQRMQNLLDECHTAFLQHASQFSNPYIKVGRAKGVPPENADILSVHDWIKGCGVRGLGKTTVQREVATRLIHMLGGSAMSGYLKL